ncbi:MAG: transposase DNA-binding-containing protein [Bacillota bacterium]
MTKTNQIEKISLADEFQNAPLSDQRLNNRPVNIANKFENQSEKSISDGAKIGRKLKQSIIFSLTKKYPYQLFWPVTASIRLNG